MRSVNVNIPICLSSGRSISGIQTKRVSLVGKASLGKVVAPMPSSKTGSVACHLPAVLDFALEKMINRKSITITLRQCHNRWLGFSELLKLSAKGIACRAQWVNGSSPKRTLYVLNRGRIAPEVFFSDQFDGHDTDLHSMVIELSVNDFDIEKSAQGYTIHIEGDELSRTQQASWKNGIFVEDQEWETLKQTATALLVENSERSMLGAGGVV